MIGLVQSLGGTVKLMVSSLIIWRGAPASPGRLAAILVLHLLRAKDSADGRGGHSLDLSLIQRRHTTCRGASPCRVDFGTGWASVLAAADGIVSRIIDSPRAAATAW